MSQRDRGLEASELLKAPWPLAPSNLTMSDGTRGVIDLRWDNPAVLSANSRFHLVGVNIYRAFDSEFGPYHRLTELPAGSTFWRDETDVCLVLDEFIDKFRQFGPRFIFQTQNYPIVGAHGIPFSLGDVRVFVDGVEAVIASVNQATGEVEISTAEYPDPNKQNYTTAVIPKTGSRVTCTYRYRKSHLRTDLGQRVFYRATSVGLSVQDSWSALNPVLLETPLEHASATSIMEIEKLDYIWREGVNRNRFILEQGGEAVRVFLRKNVGAPCRCFNDTHGQPLSDCLVCYGTGIVGGYEGPFSILIAPDDSERRIAQKDFNRTTEQSYDVWTGPQPLLCQRDFILKLNGDRYCVGPVRMPSSRGNVMQQHFTISSLDEADIRFRVPIGKVSRFQVGELVSQASTVTTDHPLIPSELQIRGRTKVWQNQNY